MKKNIGIVITDGVGFRNFLLSDFLSEAKNKFSKVVILSCLPKESYQELELDCKIIELTEFKESFVNWFFRKLKEVAHLQLHSTDNFGIKANLDKNYSTLNTPRGIATRLIFKWTRFFKSEKCIQYYYLLQAFSFKKNKITKEYQEIIKDHNLDLVFFTHQRPPFIAPIIYSSKKLGIKTCSFIFSWDNLASKGRMAGNFDFYLVWSDLMKRELLKYYPNVLEENVKIVGTPQFEPYVLEKYNLSYDEFYSKFNVEKDKPTLFYSCGDVSTSPNDNYYIETIAKAILNKSIGVDVNFIVRVSPAENGKRFEELVEKYPFISWNYPKWISYNDAHQESWSQRVPTIEDVFDLKSLLANCNLSINMLSTMSLDAMFFQKPVVNTVFGDGNNGLWNDQKFLKYEHIKTVLNTDATYLVKNETELLNSINSLLNNVNGKIRQQKTLLNLQVGAPLEGTSKRIAAVLHQWS